MVRRELGITDARQIIGPNGREVVMGGEAPGSESPTRRRR